MVGQENVTYGTGIAAVLVAEPGAPDRLAAAIAALDGRIVTRMRWNDAIDREALPRVLLVETVGVDPDLLAARLPVVAEWAQDSAAAMVIAMDAAQIDAIAAVALGGGTDLLVDPGVAECAAQIVIANERMRTPEGVYDVGRESDAVRFERLNREVARIADVLARLARAEAERDAPLPPIVGDRTNPYGAPPPASEPNAGEVRRAIRTRRARDQFFASSLFEDPGWDMLLDLYAAELERARVSVSSLCIAAAVAPTTALRWIGRMTDAGLFERRPDPHDRRRAFMALTPRASQAMRGYMVAVKRGDLGIA